MKFSFSYKVNEKRSYMGFVGFFYISSLYCLLLGSFLPMFSNAFIFLVTLATVFLVSAIIITFLYGINKKLTKIEKNFSKDE